jgi:hypothetical protein
LRAKILPSGLLCFVGSFGVTADWGGLEACGSAPASDCRLLLLDPSAIARLSSISCPAAAGAPLNEILDPPRDRTIGTSNSNARLSQDLNECHQRIVLSVGQRQWRIVRVAHVWRHPHVVPEVAFNSRVAKIRIWLFACRSREL